MTSSAPPPDAKRRFPVASTPFPNVLLDAIMPSLKDTEWRLLCVIVRQTLGWQVAEKGERKERDWLTQSQLKRRTGRASAAVSRAIDHLVRRGLIEVENEEGQLLLTPQQRRRYQGPLFFRLSPRRLETAATAGGEVFHTFSTAVQRALWKYQESCSESEHCKANTTKESLTKVVGERSVVDNGQRKSRSAAVRRTDVCCRWFCLLCSR